jgi:tetratricopeptide (TPR) repeat protein
MYNNNHEEEEIEIAALNLIDRGDDLLTDGKGKEAIDLYEQAAQKYLDLGSYIKIDELYIKIASIISKFKNNIQAVYRLKSIIRKTEELDLKEISARLLLQLGSLSYKMRDYDTAGEAWKKASMYFSKLGAEDEEFNDLSGKLLIKAGEAFERTNTNRNEGERLILKGVMMINKMDHLYKTGEKRALKLLNMEDYKAAADKYKTISTYFQKAYDTIDELTDKSDKTEVIQNAKSRLLHLKAEYLVVAALSLRASEKREFNSKIKELGQLSLDSLQKSLSLLKDVLNSEEGEIDQEDILRLTFDTLLISIINGMLGQKKIKPVNYLLTNINDKKLKKKIKKSAFFKLSKRIEKVGIRESLNKISETNLGHLNKVKKTLIPYFLT